MLWSTRSLPPISIFLCLFVLRGRRMRPSFERPPKNETKHHLWQNLLAYAALEIKRPSPLRDARAYIPCGVVHRPRWSLAHGARRAAARHRQTCRRLPKARRCVKNEYSFINHEEVGYRIVAKWPFLSGYTKLLVHWHYLLRDIEKHRTKNPYRAPVKARKLACLSPGIQEALRTFLLYDDKAKGKR